MMKMICRANVIPAKARNRVVPTGIQRIWIPRIKYGADSDHARNDSKINCFYTTILFLIICFLFPAFNIHAEEDIVSLVEQQRIELNKKEEIIKKETARLKTLKKEVNEDIAKYTKLLKQINKSLQQAEEIGNKRLRHVAKAYEAMAPEDAASRLTGLDNKTAVQILLKMNSKKAGLVIGMMEAKKATKLTKDIAKLKK